MKFNNYFNDSIEYPKIGEFHDILQEGIKYIYVSSTFLNGFINYVKPLKVFIIDRYNIDSQEEDWHAGCLLHVTKENGEWEEIKTETKQEAFDVLNRGCTVYHTNLGMFNDDVLFLGKAGDYYYFFWFDCDISDCTIGRFITNDLEEEVLKSFEEYCLSMTEDKIHEFKKDWIKGWIKF